MTQPLLQLRNLAVSFAPRRGSAPSARTRAVRNASCTVYPGQTVAIVGESGSGKSVTAMSLLGLLPAPAARIDTGEALWRTRDNKTINLLALSEQHLRPIRGGDIAMIFQEPMTCLNPVTSVGEQVREAILLHQDHARHTSATARAAAIAAMNDVGIPDAASRYRQFPHEFSGGMRQRVMIAMALACSPRLLIADEPTTALDVTIQAQVLALLKDIKQRTGMGMLLITHDMGVVANHADVVCVMYAGCVVEYARVHELFAHPLHPYTQALLQSIPRRDARRERLVTITDTLAGEGWARAVRALRETLGPGAPDPWWPTGAGTPKDETVIDTAPHLTLVSREHWVALSAPNANPSAPPDLAPNLAPNLAH